MIDDSIGIDISKDTLDAHRLKDGASRQFSNDTAGYKGLMAWIGPQVTRVVYEPTGPYHRAFERTLADAGIPLVKVNPRQATRFAEATGKLAKTDRCDAILLARMGSLLALVPRVQKSVILSELKDLHMAREALVKDRTAAKNRAKSLSIAMLKKQNGERLKQIERQLQDIDTAILAQIKADPALAASFAILVSIPGIANLTAFALIIDMPELGSLAQGEASSLAGLAPVARQSGNWKGRSFIRGGRASVRRALYMPALVAMRFNPDLKAKYEQFIKAGKPAKLAITAIMRKLIVLANALIKAQRKWTPKIT